MKLHRYILLVLAFCSVATSAQVRITYNGDTLRGHILKMTEYSGLSIRTTYTCDTSLNTQYAEFYSTAIKKLIGNWVVHFNKDNRILRTETYCDTILCESATYQYDEHKYLKEKLVTCYALGKMQRLSDFITGELSNWPSGDGSTVYDKYEYAYDACRRIVNEKEMHFSEGSYDTSITIKEYRYDSAGRQIEKRESTNPPGYKGPLMIHTYKYNALGRLSEETTLDNAVSSIISDYYNNGEPVTTKTIYLYDDLNDLVERKEYFIGISYGTQKKYSGTWVGGGTKIGHDSMLKTSTYRHYNIFREANGKERLEYEKPDIRKDSNEQSVFDEKGNLIKKLLDGNIELLREITYKN